MQPWKTKRGADWIFDRPRGAAHLTTIPPYRLGGAIECLSEGLIGAPCTQEPKDEAQH